MTAVDTIIFPVKDLGSAKAVFTTILGEHFSALIAAHMQGADGMTLLRWADWHPLRRSKLGLD